MKFTFFFRGKEKAGPLQAAIDDYVGRIQKTVPAAIVSGTRRRPWTSAFDRKIRDSYVIGLAEEGRSCSSSEFAQLLSDLMDRGAKEVMFLMGDAEGLTSELRERCNLLFSLSSLTMGHRLARLVLVEQVYRALSIIQHTPYHR